CRRIIEARTEEAEPNESAGLLRSRRERPRRSAAEQRDEVAPFQWPMSPVLPTGRIAHLGMEETAAVLDFMRPMTGPGQVSVIRRCRLTVRFPTNDPTGADSGAQVFPPARATVPPSLRGSSSHVSNLPACCALAPPACAAPCSCHHEACSARSAWLPLGRACLSAWIEHRSGEQRSP